MMFNDVQAIKKSNEQLRQLICQEEQLIDRDKWHLDMQQKALNQLVVDDRLCRQDIILYSSNLMKQLDLRVAIRQIIQSIESKAVLIAITSNDDHQLRIIQDKIKLLKPQHSPQLTRIQLGLEYLMKGKIESI